MQIKQQQKQQNNPPPHIKTTATNNKLLYSVHHFDTYPVFEFEEVYLKIREFQ
jgi:hypothetical protein